MLNHKAKYRVWLFLSVKMYSAPGWGCGVRTKVVLLDPRFLTGPFHTSPTHTTVATPFVPDTSHLRAFCLPLIRNSDS